MAELIKSYNFINVMTEPMTTNKYVVEFVDKNIDIPEYLIQKISLPKFSNGEWEEMSMEIINTIDCSTIVALNKILNKFDAQYEIKIKILDAVGVVVGFWNLNCHITGIDFGDFKYSSKEKLDELLISKIKFKILDCKFEI